MGTRVQDIPGIAGDRLVTDIVEQANRRSNELIDEAVGEVLDRLQNRLGRSR